MFKRSFLLFLTIWLTLSAAADRNVLPIERIALDANIIVIGEIVSVGKETYQFKVAEYIKGKGGLVLTIQKFKEWICDTRYAPVQVGQHLFLFLTGSKSPFVLFNASTGEIPILRDSITLNNEIIGHDEHYQAINYKTSLLEFKEGIKSFIHCFRIPDDEYLKQNQIIQICKPLQLKAFIGKSSFTKWLYKKIKNQYQILTT